MEINQNDINDRMSSVPLLNLNDHNRSGSPNSDHGWSDQEMDDQFSQDPLEGVLRSVLQRPKSISRIQCIVSSIFLVIFSLSLGFVGAYLVYFIFLPPPCWTFYRNSNINVTSQVLVEIQPNNLMGFLRNLTSETHPAGSGASYQLAEILSKKWKQFGMDEVKMNSYKVLLSFPHSTYPNKITVADRDGKRIENLEWEVRHRPLNSPEESDSKIIFPFSPYSASGVVKGDLVFVNYGRRSDFTNLMQQGINISSCIIIARYGKLHTNVIVKNANKFHAKGVLLYSDPVDYAPQGRNNVYPKYLWTPNYAVVSETSRLKQGDPLTPNYSSTGSAPRITEDFKGLSIFVQPISFEIAEDLLKLLMGASAPETWNVKHKIGPGLVYNQQQGKIVMNITTKNKEMVIFNVIGSIKGEYEPDRYVIIGSQRDSLTFGGIGSASGTSVLLEISRVISKLHKNGWNPRRTILFCSWDASEFNFIGSTEWMEQNMKLLMNRAVAYINIDSAVEGNASLMVDGSPLIHSLVYEASRKIPNPNINEISEGRLTVFDTWMHYFNQSKPPVSFGTINSGSSGFGQYLGIPTLELSYSYDQKKYHIKSHPLKHTLYDTYFAAEMIDPGFQYHASVAKLLAELLRQLSNSVFIPFNVNYFAKFIEETFQSFKVKSEQVLTNQKINLDDFEYIIKNFTASAMEFSKQIHKVNPNNLMEVRTINDQLLQLEKSFISNDGLSSLKDFRHVLYSPSENNDYEIQGFGTLHDILDSITESYDFSQVDKLKHHISCIIQCIETATLALKGAVL